MKPNTKTELERFKSGIFSLNTRRFGKLAELMIQILYKLNDSPNTAYDKVDKKGKRIEVKFSTVLKISKNKIKKDNVIKEAIYANTVVRKVNSTDNCKYDCNIQQVKTKEFDVLYYGLFFYD